MREISPVYNEGLTNRGSTRVNQTRVSWVCLRIVNEHESRFLYNNRHLQTFVFSHARAKIAFVTKR